MASSTADDTAESSDPLPRIIHNYWDDIVCTVGAEHVIPNLRRVLNGDEAEEVLNHSRLTTRKSRTNYLLDLLEKRSGGLTHFVVALRGLYPQLYQTIVDAYVKAATGQQLGPRSEETIASPGVHPWCGSLVIHLLTDLEERLTKCEADLKKEREEHAATREQAKVTLWERNEAQRDIEQSDMSCQSLQERLESCQTELSYQRSANVEMISARNAAWQTIDELQDMLRSKIAELEQIKQEVHVLEQKWHSISNRLSIADDEVFSNRSNMEIQAEQFKQQLVEQQTQLWDLQFQVARLKDQLSSANRRNSVFSESGDFDFDSEFPMHSHKISLNGEMITGDQSSPHVVDLDCSAAPHGIEVTGLAVVKQVMSSSPAYHQGLVHEGDIIATINDVDLGTRLSQFANDLMRASGSLQLQVYRPLPGSLMSRCPSGASGVSTGSGQRKASKGSTSYSSYGYRQGKPDHRLSVEHEISLSSSLQSLPEATLALATEPHAATRRRSITRNGITLTTLKRNSEFGEDLSKSLTALHEMSAVTGFQSRLSRMRGSRLSQTLPTTRSLQHVSSQIKTRRKGMTCSPRMICSPTSPHTSSAPNSPIIRQGQVMTAGSEPEINGQMGIETSTSNTVRSVTVMTCGLSPAIQVVGGLGRGIFITRATGVVTEGEFNEGDQILELNGVNFKKVTHAKAVQAIRGNIEIQVTYNPPGYEDVVDSNFGTQDSFYVRALFAYSGHGSEEHAFEPGTVFHVIETLIPDKIDSWLAYPVSRNGKDMHEARLIPGLKRAAELHREAAASATEMVKTSKLAKAGWKRHSLKRKAATSAPEPIEQVLDSDSTHLGYERVKPCEVVAARPVMLLGVLTVPISEHLVSETSTVRFIRCQSTMTGINDLASNKFHCVVESDASCISKLRDRHLHPIVIFITPRNRKISKSLPSGVSRHDLESQLEASELVKKLYGHEFSGQVTLPSPVDFPETVRTIVQIVEEQQENTVWDVDTEVLMM